MKAKHPRESQSHLCNLCGMKFLIKRNWQYHMNRCHPASDETTCKHCGLILQNVFTLKNHLQAHEPPAILCPVCGKRFAKREYLKNHTRTHTGEKAYQCDLCYYKSAADGNLSNHKKFVHQKQPRKTRSTSKKTKK